jgi:hypothetical protein
MLLHSAHYCKKLLLFTVPFALAIFFGSFLLGWHYVIDDYVSILGVLGIWHLNAWQVLSDKAVSSTNI